jgi:hypothetical protein
MPKIDASIEFVITVIQQSRYLKIGWRVWFVSDFEKIQNSWRMRIYLGLYRLRCRSSSVYETLQFYLKRYVKVFRSREMLQMLSMEQNFSFIA